MMNLVHSLRWVLCWIVAYFVIYIPFVVAETINDWDTPPTMIVLLLVFASAISHYWWKSGLFTFQIFSRIKNTRSFHAALSKLDSPVKRAGFLVLCLGLLLSIGGTIQVSDRYSPFETWTNAVFDPGSSDAEYYWLASWGAYLFATGLLFSFLYDATIQKLVNWIMASTDSRQK